MATKPHGWGVLKDMSPKKFLGVSIGIGVLMLGAAGVLLLGSKVDDQKLIQEAITEAIKAGKDGRPGGVLDNISIDFRINDQDAGSRFQIADYVKKMKPEVQLPPYTAQIFGDEAIITTPMTLNVGILTARTDIPLKDVTIKMRKEDARKWLVIPTHRWRVAEVKVPQDAVPSALMGF